MTEIPGFSDLQARIFELYNAKEYEEALEIATQQAPHYPTKRDTVAYWRACLAAHTDQESLAVWILEEAIATGTWWSPNWLRAEDDFATLQDNTDFQRLIEICERRRDAAAARAVPATMVAQPDGDGPWPALVALHGAGSNASTALADWHVAVRLGRMLVLPQATDPSGPDAFRWGEHDETAIARSLEAVRARIAGDDVVLAGFSAGGRLALQASLTEAVPARGVIAVAAAPLDVSLVEPHLDAAAARGLRAFIVAGGRDIGGSAWAQDLAGELNRRGVATTLDFRPELTHVFPPDFDDVLGRALAFVAGR